MHIHKVLRGAGAALYLPFGLSRLKALHRQHGDGYFSQKYIINGTQVEVTHRPGYAVVRVTAAITGFHFEFQTSGFPVQTRTDTHFGDIYKAGTIRASSLNGVALAQLLGGALVNFTDATEPLKRAQQVQLEDEPISYPIKTNKIYDRLLLESWSPGSPHSGVLSDCYHLEMFPWGSNDQRGSAISYKARDVAYDVGYADMQDVNHVRYAYLRTHADWPRSAGIRKVVDALYGTREFAIYVDAFDQVSAFPTAEITSVVEGGDGTPNQNVLDTYVQYARVAFPAWVYAKTEKFSTYFSANPGDIGLTEFPEYDWKIHPDGTKMCAVVYERDAATFDAAHYGAFDHTWDGTSGHKAFMPNATSWGVFNTEAFGINPQFGSFDSPSTMYQVGTGLLEVSINISLTGTNPEDFTLTLSPPTEVRRPTTSDLCTLLAGYSFVDIKSSVSTAEFPDFDVNRGDMLVVDVECHGRDTDAAYGSFLSVKNLTNSREIRVFPCENRIQVVNDLVTNQLAKIVACDLGTVSFAVKHGWADFSNNGTICHFGVAVYTLNQHRKTFYPATIDPAAQTRLDALIASNGRTVLADAFGVVDLMPLSESRTWGDTDMDALREDYDVTTRFVDPSSNPAFLDGTPVALIGNFAMNSSGLKYHVATRAHSAPTANATRWFYDLLSGGNTTAIPFPLFNLSNPLVGRYQYAEHLTKRINISPFNTFFTHPNGSWAFFSQEWLYNKAGQRSTLVAGAGTIGQAAYETCAVSLDVANFEHCIFDGVHIQGKLDSTFVALYNKAIAAGIHDGTLTDSLTAITVDDLRATFDTDTIPDATDSTVTYHSLKVSWQGIDFRLTDHAYYDGTKKLHTGSAFQQPFWEVGDDGLLLQPSLGAFWNDIDYTRFLMPQLGEGYPATFCTCALIDG